MATTAGATWRCRAVASIGQAYTGYGRFVVADMTKGGKHRNVSLRDEIADMLAKHIADHRIEAEDLLFPHDLLAAEIRAVKAARRAVVLARPIPDDLGRTDPNAGGRTFRHGTLNAYIQGACRCEWCRHRMAQWSATRVNTQPRSQAFDARKCNRPPRQRHLPHPRLAPRPRCARLPEGCATHLPQASARARVLAARRRRRPGRGQGNGSGTRAWPPPSATSRPRPG